jgi:hypothetical protein
VPIVQPKDDGLPFDGEYIKRELLCQELQPVAPMCLPQDTSSHVRRRRGGGRRVGGVGQRLGIGEENQFELVVCQKKQLVDTRKGGSLNSWTAPTRSPAKATKKRSGPHAASGARSVGRQVASVHRPATKFTA